MKTCIKSFGSVKIYEEVSDQRCKITAEYKNQVEALVGYAISDYTENKIRQDFFRGVALSYFQEIKKKFENN
jgi:hypothetical protein